MWYPTGDYSVRELGERYLHPPLVLNENWYSMLFSFLYGEDININTVSASLKKVHINSRD